MEDEISGGWMDREDVATQLHKSIQMSRTHTLIKAIEVLCTVSIFLHPGLSGEKHSMS